MTCMYCTAVVVNLSDYDNCFKNIIQENMSQEIILKGMEETRNYFAE